MIANAVLGVASLALLFGALWIGFRKLGAWLDKAVRTDSITPSSHSAWGGNGA